MRKAMLLLAGTLAAFFKSYEYSSLGALDKRMWGVKEIISGKRISFIRNNPQLFTGDFQHLFPKPKP